jgi:hypothetical protein
MDWKEGQCGLQEIIGMRSSTARHFLTGLVHTNAVVSFIIFLVEVVEICKQKRKHSQTM